uniref:Uncharacterized protein n=1 Tax=Populus trichocarpa TaxID=3694 RepID=A0A2K1Y470_POPTR
MRHGEQNSCNFRQMLSDPDYINMDFLFHLQSVDSSRTIIMIQKINFHLATNCLDLIFANKGLLQPNFRPTSNTLIILGGSYNHH